MELLFESRHDLGGMSGHLRFFQRQPRLHEGYVLQPDSPDDRLGANLYGTVVNEGGTLRMWYLGFPEGFPAHTLGGSATVCYAESTDGDTWTKPALGLIPGAPKSSNRVDLGLHSATLFVDPTAPASHRYRAVGCGRPVYHGLNPGVTRDGYYTAHSADGFRWALDDTAPRWGGVDVVTSTYHPGLGEGLVAMKFTPTVGGVCRRSIHTARCVDGVYSDHVAALYPDDFDDVCALRHGFRSADYYGMGMLPAGRSATVGFLWRFWHQLPYSKGWGNGQQALYGQSDISLVYQPEPGASWLHLAGRPDFISREAVGPESQWVYSSSTPVEIGDEQRLYFTSRPMQHGYGREIDWSASKTTQYHGFEGGGVTYAAWPKWRLFGFEAKPYGTLTIHLGEIKVPSKVRLNYETLTPGGSVRAALKAGGELVHEADTFDVLGGEAIAAELRWGGEAVVQPARQAALQLTLDHARVYAYEVVPL